MEEKLLSDLKIEKNFFVENCTLNKVFNKVICEVEDNQYIAACNDIYSMLKYMMEKYIECHYGEKEVFDIIQSTAMIARNCRSDTEKEIAEILIGINAIIGYYELKDVDDVLNFLENVCDIYEKIKTTINKGTLEEA